MEEETKCDIDVCGLSSLDDEATISYTGLDRSDSPDASTNTECNTKSVRRISGMIEFECNENKLPQNHNLGRDVDLKGATNQLNDGDAHLTNTSNLAPLKSPPYHVRQSYDTFSSEKLGQVSHPEVYTYSTELSDDKETPRNQSKHMLQNDKDKSLPPKSTFIDSSNNIEGRPLMNLQGGTFGSVPRPPRPSASFCRLDVSTDLNLPPPNWLNVDPSRLPPGLAGFNATPHYSGFSSFRMASLFLEYSSRQRLSIDGKSRDRTLGLRGIDVVSDAENIKKLLKMPYSSKTPVSMIVHRIGQSILIDDMDLHRLAGLLNTISGSASMQENEFSREAEEWAWLKDFFYEIMLTSYESKEKALVRRNTNKNAMQERNLISKFLHRSLENKLDDSRLRIKQSPIGQSILSLSIPPSNSSTDIESNNILEQELKKANSSQSFDFGDISDTSVQLPPLPEPNSEDLSLFSGVKGIGKNHIASRSGENEGTTKDFARTLLWNFEDIRMLIGSDMPIFGDKDHPSVSLRLHNAQKPIHILTGLDYWLDNLMCQVPEVLMCFHVDGIVQKYELYKTEELPALSEGGNFSPGVIRDVAQNILSFLKTHAAKEGHTYWLFKGKDDDTVKLYDLTGLCDEYDSKENVQTECNETECGFNRSTGVHTPNQAPPCHSGKESSDTRPPQKNPFRTAVSLLLYKVARNILQNTENRAGDEARAKQLLTNCLKLLDQDKYPQIATSAHFMLSDLYVPDDIDPANPKAKFVQGKHCDDTQGYEYYRKTNLHGGETKSSFCENIAKIVQPASIDLKTITNASRKSQRRTSGVRKHSKQQEYTETSKEDHPGSNFISADDFIDDDELIFTSPPITSSVVERCKEALSHASEGLSSLKHLEKRRNEDKLKENKAREQYERENPKMSKPYEAIPMPYSNQDHKTLITRTRSRCQSESAATTLANSRRTGRSSMSWHDHLKTVLFKKATIIYVVLAETHFVAQNYGHALRCVKRSLNCYEMVCCLTGLSSPLVNTAIENQNMRLAAAGNLEKHVSSFISFAFGLAGDSYYNILQNWSAGVVAYQEEFNAANDISDKTIMEVIESSVDEARREWSIKLPKDIEEAMHLANKCFDMAILLCDAQQCKNGNFKEEVVSETNDSISGILSYEYDLPDKSFYENHMTEELKTLLNRRGNLSNEMGVFYVNQADLLVKSEHLNFNGNVPEPVVKILNISAMHLKNGLKDFKVLCDIPNQALVMSNSGRHCRLYAYCYSLVETEEKSIEINMFRSENDKYKQAIELYETAMKILTSHEANAAGFAKGKRNQYSKIYESVSWDLQTTCFIWGTRLQDSTPKEAYSMEEVEKMVVDLYGRALRYCDIETPGPRQPVFQYRAASIHMKLGSLYHLKYRSDDDIGKVRESKPNKGEHRKKNMKQLAENHYAKAVLMFKELEHGQEFLRAQMERVFLHEPVPSNDKSSTHGLNNSSKKIYHTIFELFCDCLPILQVTGGVEKLSTPTNKNMLGSDEHKYDGIKNDGKDEEEIPSTTEIHIFDVLIKKIQNNLLDLTKLLSVKTQQTKNSGKANILLEMTKKFYLKSIMLKSRNTTFMKDLISLLETLKKDFLRYLR